MRVRSRVRMINSVIRWSGVCEGGVLAVGQTLGQGGAPGAVILAPPFTL